MSVNHDFKTEVKRKNMEGNGALNFGSTWRRLVSFDKAARALGEDPFIYDSNNYSAAQSNLNTIA